MVEVTEASRAKIGFERGEARRQVLFTIGVELDAQDGAWFALDESAARLIEGEVLTGVVENRFIHHFDRGGLVRQNGRCRAQRFQQMMESDSP